MVTMPVFASRTHGCTAKVNEDDIHSITLTLALPVRGSQVCVVRAPYTLEKILAICKCRFRDIAMLNVTLLWHICQLI